MSTYNEIKKAALSLTEKEQEKLLAELTAAHTARKANERAEKSTGWKKTAWKVAAAAATIAGIVIAGVSVSGCASSVKQVQPDGSSTERTFILDGASTAQLIRLYGVPQVPVVNVGK